MLLELEMPSAGSAGHIRWLRVPCEGSRGYNLANLCLSP